MKKVFVLNTGTVIRLSSINSVSAVYKNQGGDNSATHYYFIYINGASKPYIHNLNVSEIYLAGAKPTITRQRLIEALAEFEHERKNLINKWVELD